MNLEEGSVKLQTYSLNPYPQDPAKLKERSKATFKELSDETS